MKSKWKGEGEPSGGQVAKEICVWVIKGDTLLRAPRLITGDSRWRPKAVEEDEWRGGGEERM